MNACDSDATKSFVILGLNLGLRKNELLSLMWKDVNLQDRYIILKDTKNMNEDTVPLNETVTKHLKKLPRTSEFVISKPNGDRYRDFRNNWSRIVKKAGLSNFTPHDMRHTFASTLIREGADIMAVKELGRWSDLKLVERYAHVAKDHRTRVISKLDGKFSNDNQGGTKGDTVSD